MVAEPTVVVVDDDEAVRDSLQAMLEAEGFVVETFPGAADFLEGFRPTPKSCLLIDVRMPGMGWHRAADQARDARQLAAGNHDDRARRRAHGGQGDEAGRPGLHREAVRGRDARAQHPRRAGCLSPGRDGDRDRSAPSPPHRARARGPGAVGGRPVQQEKMQAHSLSHLVRMALAAGIDPGEA